VRSPHGESGATVDILENQETPKAETYNTICKVEDICFINVFCEKDCAVDVVISRVSGIPLFLTFGSRSTAASFVTAVGGYYQLSVKWSVELCDEFVAPSLKFRTRFVK